MRKRYFYLLLVALTALHILVLFAGFFAPYDPEEQNRLLPFAPPVRIHFRDRNGLHLRPFVYAIAPRESADETFRDDKTRAYAIQFFVQGAPYRAFGFMTLSRHLIGTAFPGRLSFFGTDAFGRDLFSRTLYGGQISLLSGWLATILALGIGTLAGACAGFWGGWVDSAVMRLSEVFLALPWLYLLFAVRAFLPLSISTVQAFFLVITVIGVVGWARPARLIRGVVLSARERDYVRAARGFGGSNVYLLRRHVIPQTYGVLRTQAALLIPQYILAEVTLSFLGLGVGEPAASWGTLLATLKQYHVLVSFWWMFLPGLVMLMFFLGYAALANTLQELDRHQSL